MITTVATKLNRARILQGLTLEELANKVNCSKQAIGHYETGYRMPDSQTLLRIAAALDVDIDYFYDSSEVGFHLSNVFYREGKMLSQDQRSEVENLVSTDLNNYLELESISKELAEFENPINSLLINNSDDVEKAAKQLRKRWQIGAGPVYNIANLLEKKGIRILKINYGCIYNHEAFSGWAENDKVPVIVLNARQQDVCRIRFTLLHELGHLLLIMHDSVDGDLTERLCDTFAGAVLLPAEILEQEFGRNRTAITMPELRRIKELYGISIAAIMVRARTTKLISPQAYGKWKEFDFYDRDYGHYNGTEEPQRFLQMLYRCLSEKKIGFDTAAKFAKKDEFELRLIYKQQVEF